MKPDQNMCSYDFFAELENCSGLVEKHGLEMGGAVNFIWLKCLSSIGHIYLQSSCNLVNHFPEHILACLKLGHVLKNYVT